MKTKIKKAYALISFCVLFTFNATAQTTLELQPDSTTGNYDFISSLNPSSPDPTNPEFDALAWTNFGTPFLLRGLVDFDLTSIPPGSVIQSAYLTLYNNPNSANGPKNGQHSQLSGSNSAWLQRVTSSWNPNTTSWNNQPSTTTVDEATLPADTNPNENYIVDVTTLVQDMINNPATSFGFMLQLQTEQYYRCMVFASCYHPDSLLHPKLVITYTSVAPPVTSFQASDSVLCANDCIAFTDQSTNATAWQWFFPGASPVLSTVENPQNICYQAAGNYDVMLIASNAAGSDTLYMTKYITVNASPPIPMITQSGDTLFCSADTSYSSYQWYYYNAPVLGATDTFLVAYYNGNYNLKVTNKSGCSVADGINVATGINGVDANSYFNIYPNPATSQLTIHSSSVQLNKGVTVSVMNVLGQEASPPAPLQRRGEEAVIDISALSAGMYFLQMKSESGSVVKRFVKE